MKRNSLILLLISIVAFNAHSQTLYVPSGTSGIGTSLNGNVGIGTSGPRSPLEVHVTGNNSTVQTGLIVQQINPGSPNNAAGVSLDFGIGNNWTNTNIVGKITFKETYWSTRPKMFFSLWDENNIMQDRMVVDHLGNVGIGTQAPESKFHIAEGGFRHGGTGEINIDAPGIIGGRFKILNNGNVGIGPIVPQAKLHVNNGEIRASDPNFSDINVRMDGTSIPTIKFTRYIGTPSHYHNAIIGQFYNTALSSYSLGIGTGSSTTGDQNATTNAITIPISGNVGIGTNVPAAKLDVGAFIPNGALGTILGRLQEGNSTGAGTFLGVKGYGTQQTDYSGKSFALEHSFYGIVNSSINFYRGGGMGGGFLTFNTSENLERMRLTGDGNLCIGTDNPHGFKLAVAGKTITEEVVVQLQGSWPDYVFSPNYKLPSLSELEQYIKTNNHLPEVPTAEQVKENGLSVGEMNAILLKKVEELTLYLIQDRKVIEELQQENKKQQKEIELLKSK